MCGWRMRASARTSRKNAVRREGVSTRTRLAATSAPRHRASVISPEEPLPRTVPTASDPPAAGSAAAEALVEAPGGLFAPTSSSAASISQPPARAVSMSAGRDAHGSSGLPDMPLSVAIGEVSVELGVRRSGSEQWTG